MREFFDAATEADEEAAVALVHRALEAGLPPERVLLDVIAPAQARVGEEWAAARLSVAREHAASAVSDRAITALSVHPAARAVPRRGRVTMACVDGEWHALPARLVAETLRLRGWRVDFLGAHVPPQHLVQYLHATGPDAVALSCSIPTRLPAAHAAITACRAVGVPVLAGGPGFGADGRYARLLGADAWAASATDAADRLERDWPPPVRPADGKAWHLAGREYGRVAGARSRLVAEALEALREELPETRSYTSRQWESTAEDLAHIVDFLAASLYVDDERLFTDFVAWTAAVLSARGVPTASLAAGLRLLEGLLRGLPRARRTVGAGLAAVGGSG
ncbi:B12-binding domain-containing protein [Streptomyces sp. NPDC059637]|uniref:cobalamin B12-binding domain-containing protein n=1 Tax=Streptomyces sp. NPDC059637 TaxID=3347752 RepID=UPI00369C1BA7